MQQHNKTQSMALNRSRKGHFTIWELKQAGRASPQAASAGNVCGATQIVHHSTHVPNDLQSAVRIDLGLQMNFSK